MFPDKGLSGPSFIWHRHGGTSNTIKGVRPSSPASKALWEVAATFCSSHHDEVQGLPIVRKVTHRMVGTMDLASGQRTRCLGLSHLCESLCKVLCNGRLLLNLPLKRLTISTVFERHFPKACLQRWETMSAKSCTTDTHGASSSTFSSDGLLHRSHYG